MNREIEARLKISAVDRTQKGFDSVSRRLRQVERQTSAYNRAERQIAGFRRTEAAASGALITNARLLGGAAVVAGVAQTVRAFSSYEDALVEIRKKGGFTEEQIAKVGEEARALATSGELAVPLEEILSAYERGAAAGLPLEDLRAFAGLSSKASDAFGMAAEDVGNAAAGFNVGLGIPIAKMEEYFDLINTLADSGISDEVDIITYLDNAGAALKNFGLSADQAAAYGAAFLNLKLGPETAARMTNALTSKLIAPENLGDEAFGVFSDFVGDVEAFKDLLKDDAQGALRKFLGDLAKLDKFDRARVTGMIFGMEWSDEIMRVVEGIEEVDRNLEQAANRGDWLGSLERSYALKLDTMSSKWAIFKNQIGELAIDVGSMGLPAMEAGLDAAKGLVEDIDAGLKLFSAKIDTGAFNEAREAIFGVQSDINELAGMEVAQDSEVVRFFKDLAVIANTVNETITAIGGAIDTISDPLGLKANEDPAASTAYAPFFGDQEKFGISVGGGLFGIGDRINSAIGGVSDFLGWADERNEAALASERDRLAEAKREGVTGETAARRDERLAAADAGEIDDGRSIFDAKNAAYAERADAPWISVPSVGLRVGPFTGSDDANAAADARWQEDLDASSEALRAAMESGGVTITDAGTQAGSAISTAGTEASASLVAAIAAMAGALQGAISAGGADIEAAIRRGLASGIRLPNGTVAPAKPNANLGRTAPDAGTPGL